MTAAQREAVRLRIYVGEEKRDGDQLLYQAIVRQARMMHMAGTTVYRATQGFGRSTRLHTSEVLFSQDLPVVIEVIDTVAKTDALLALLESHDDIGLITYETVKLRGRRDLNA